MSDPCEVRLQSSTVWLCECLLARCLYSSSRRLQMQCVSNIGIWTALFTRGWRRRKKRRVLTKIRVWRGLRKQWNAVACYALATLDIVLIAWLVSWFLCTKITLEQVLYDFSIIMPFVTTESIILVWIKFFFFLFLFICCMIILCQRPLSCAIFTESFIMKCVLLLGNHKNLMSY